MKRYFIEVAYKGTAYAGFQVQQNALTIQEAVEKALAVLYREAIVLTGSSRTDAGVHARQNYFHFDSAIPVAIRHIYNLNALLPEDIMIRRIIPVADQAHCRFDALSRLYRYEVYREKDPFRREFAYYYPYELSRPVLEACAAELLGEHDFTSFSKRNTQVKTFRCRVMESSWSFEAGSCCYRVRANRFLRGMVRGLVGTMLQLARRGGNAEEIRAILAARDCGLADFSVPGHGLWLEEVAFGAGYFGEAGGEGKIL